MSEKENPNIDPHNPQVDSSKNQDPFAFITNQQLPPEKKSPKKLYIIIALAAALLVVVFLMVILGNDKLEQTSSDSPSENGGIGQSVTGAVEIDALSISSDGTTLTVETTNFGVTDGECIATYFTDTDQVSYSFNSEVFELDENANCKITTPVSDFTEKSAKPHTLNAVVFTTSQDGSNTIQSEVKTIDIN